MKKLFLDKSGKTKIAIIISLVLILISTILFSSAFIPDENYFIGDEIKIDLSNEGNYSIKIITPSKTFIREGENDVFRFSLEEIGDYSVKIRVGEENEVYFFKVVNSEKEVAENISESSDEGFVDLKEEREEILVDSENEGSKNIKVGEPVIWKKKVIMDSKGNVNIKIPSYGKNISVKADGVEKNFEEKNDSLVGIKKLLSMEIEKEIIVEEVSGKIELEYETPAPTKKEEELGEGKKKVTVSSPEEVHYENVLAFTNVEEKISLDEKDSIQIYWVEEKINLNFSVFDLDNDSLIDYIEWIVPHLSTQTFEIILTTDAMQLDSNRNFLRNIYDKVKSLDLVGALISDGEYVRVTFEKLLDSSKDITIYANSSDGARVEVYEKNGNKKIADFGEIKEYGKYKIYLNDLVGVQDTFDLLIIGGNIFFDWIVDPSDYTGCTGNVCTEVFNTTGSTYWTAPSGVTSVNVTAIGGGGGGSMDSRGNGGSGGGGGGLGWRNDIPVVPGTNYTVVVGTGGQADSNTGATSNAGAGGDSYFINNSFVAGLGGGAGGDGAGGTGGSYAGAGGGSGGTGGTGDVNEAGGGGGAGGYSGNGGDGGSAGTGNGAGGNGAGGAGGGAGDAGNNDGAAGGGGTGIFGEGASGTGGSASSGNGNPGTGGSGGDDGHIWNEPADGGLYGGGGGGAENTNSENGAGGQGAVAISYLINSAPTQDTPKLNSSEGKNESDEYLVCNENNVSDYEGVTPKLIYNWHKNGSLQEVINFPFEGGSDSSFTKDYADSSNGTINGATWNGSGGYDGYGAYEFDGSNDYINTSFSLGGMNTDWTFSAWIKWEGGTEERCIFGEDNSGQNLCMGVKNNLLWLRASRVSNFNFANTDVSDSGWHHAVFVGNSTHTTGYLDGSFGQTVNDNLDLSSTGNFWIGLQGGSTRYWNGTIDDVRVYNHTLSDDQILKLYQDGGKILSSNETSVGDSWVCEITPNDGLQDGSSSQSNSLYVKTSTVDVAPNITINSPSNGSTLSDVTPLMNVTIEGTASIVTYSVNGGANQTICSSCTGDQTMYIWLPEGESTIEFYAQSGSLYGYNSTTFTVDMNYSYYDTFTDNSSIQDFGDVNWSVGNISFVAGDPNLFTEDFETDLSQWTEELWGRDNTQSHGGSWSVFEEDGTSNLTADAVDTTDAELVNVTFWYRKQNLEDDDMQIWFYDGTNWDYIDSFGADGVDNSWHFKSYTTTDSQYFHSNFQVRFVGDISDTYIWIFLTDDEDIWIDDFNITQDVATTSFTSYPINTTQNVVEIVNVTWNEAGTDSNNNITVEMSVDNGQNWYTATKNQGISPSVSSDELLYRVLFEPTTPGQVLTLLDMSFNWSSTVPPSPNITIYSPTPGSTFADVTPLVNVSLDETATTLFYSVDGGTNQTICSACSGIQDNLFVHLDEDVHTIDFYAINSVGSVSHNSTTFTVDMNYNYYDTFTDNSSILSINSGVTWGVGNISYTKPDPDFFTDGFESGFSKWQSVGGWTQDTSRVNTGTYSAHASWGNDGNLDTNNIDTSNVKSINVTFYYNEDDLEDTDLQIYFYNGTGYNLIDSIGADASEDTWHFKTYNTSDSQYFIEDFHVRIFSEPDFGFGGGAENAWIDDVNVEVELNVGDFVSYSINTSTSATEILNVSWSESGTGSGNNVSVQITPNGGTDWYNATNGQGISDIEAGDELVYKVIFDAVDTTTMSLLDMNFTWTDTIYPAPNITIISPTLSSTYADVTPLLNISIDEVAEAVWYSTDGGQTNTTLCINCEVGGYSTYMHLKEGDFTVLVYANNSVGSISSNSTDFTVALNKNYFDTFDDNSSLIPAWTSSGITWGPGNVNYVSSGAGSENYTAFWINTTQPIKSLSNVTWSTSGEAGGNTIAIDFSFDGGQSWNSATNGAGLTGFTASNYMLYRAIFTTTSATTLSLLDINVTWTEPPNVVIYYPQSGIYGGSVTWLNYTATAGSGTSLDACWWSNDSGTTNYTIACGTNISTSAVEGYNNWTVYANDTDGGIGQDKVTFLLDTTSPVIGFINQTDSGGENVTFTNPLEQGDDLNILVDVSDSSLDKVWIVVWEGVKGGVEKVKTFFTYIAGLSLFQAVLQTDISWGLADYNYTIYANDTQGLTSEYDGTIDLIKLISSLVLNPNPTPGTGGVVASGFINLSNGTAIPNHPINFWLDGELLTMDNLTGVGVYDNDRELIDTSSTDFNEGIFYRTETSGGNLTLTSGNKSGNFTKTLDAGGRVKWNAINWSATGSSCSGVYTWQEGVDDFYGTEDSYLDGTNPNSNYGSLSSMNLDTSPLQRPIIYFDAVGEGTNKVPFGATINGANITVNVFDAGSSVSIYEILEEWDESQVTYNNRLSGTSWGSAGISGYPSRSTYLESSFTPSSTGNYTFDITNAMNRWVNGTSTNYGLVLNPGGTNTVSFRSSEYSSQNLRPKLTVGFSSTDCTDVTAYVRMSNDGDSWSSWQEVGEGQQISDLNIMSRYLQYTLELSSLESTSTPIVSEVTVNYTAIVTDSSGYYAYNFTPPSTFGTYPFLMNTSLRTMITNSSSTLDVQSAVAPQVELINPTDNTWWSSGSLNLTYNVSDANSDVINTSLFLNGAYDQSNSTAINYGLNNFSVSLGSGEYNWSVKVIDGDSNQDTTSNWTFYVDLENPVVSLIAPPNATPTTLAEFNLSFNVTDNMDSSLICDLVLDGSTIYPSMSVSNSSTENRSSGVLEDGLHYWNVTCTDESGRQGTSPTWIINVTDSPPEVTLTWPSNNYSDPDGNISFQFNVTDNSGIQNCSLILNETYYYLNQSEINFEDSPGASNNINLTGMEEGNYNWTVGCYDLSSGYHEDSKLNFSVDLNDPEVYLNLPANSGILGISDVNLNFTVNDTLDSLLSCIFNIDSSYGASFDAAEGALTNVLYQDLFDGIHYWNVTCSDDSGRVNISGTRNFTVAEPPKIFLNTSNDTYFSSSDVDLNYTAYDNTNLSNCSLYMDASYMFSNVTEVFNGQLSSFTMGGVSDGLHNWSINCSDVAGNNNVSEIRWFYVDAGAPQPSLIYPDGDDIYTLNVTFNFTVTDEIDPSVQCNISVDSFVVDENFTADNDTIISREVSGIADGFHYWNATCWDSANNVNTSAQTFNFTLLNPPEVNLTSPMDGYWFNTSTINLTYYAYDDVGLNISYLILNGTIDQTNQTPMNNGGNSSFIKSGVSDGSYNWTVIVTDAGGMNGTDTERTFFIDTISPSVIQNSPQPEEVITTNNVTINASVSDNLDPQIYCSLDIDGSNEYSGNVANGTDFINYQLLPDGLHEWNMTCVDEAGHVNSTGVWNFTVVAPPYTELISPAPDYYGNDTIFNFSYIPHDALGIDQCDLFIDGVLNDTDNSPTPNVINNFSVPGILEGIHNWTVNCSDPDSNWNWSAERNFTRDISPPLINLVSPGDGAFLDASAGNVIFRWTPIDYYDDFFYCDLFVDGNLKVDDKFVQNDTLASESVSGLGVGEHTWNVTCWDGLNNLNNSATWTFNLTYPDFYINSSEIYFNVTNPVENESININATIQNIGYANSTNIMVQFYLGNPSSGGIQIGNNQTIDLDVSQEINISQEYSPQLGLNEIYVIIDQYSTITETNENNNLGNKNTSVGAWQFFYGDLLPDTNYSLENSNNESILDWSVNDFNGGSVFVTDIDSSISWPDVLALGKTTLGGDSSLDLSEADSLLSMGGFQDSIVNLYLGDQDSFSVFDRTVDFVPITNSTNNTNFVTGILWDSDDTVGDNEYDSTDAEDLIFVAKIKDNLQGAYGVYDYELRVPANLRNYSGGSSNTVAFYMEVY